MKVTKRTYFATATICLLAVAGCVYYYLFSSMTGKPDKQYLYVDGDDTADSVFTKLRAISTEHGQFGFQTLARHAGYAGNIRTGRYAIAPGEGALTAFRHIRNGQQEPLNLTIPTARTIGKLSAALAQKLMLDSAELSAVLMDSAVCWKYGHTPETIVSMFVPNTYDVYWNISAKALLDRMQKECSKFWNADRMKKAELNNNLSQ